MADTVMNQVEEDTDMLYLDDLVSGDISGFDEHTEIDNLFMINSIQIPIVDSDSVAVGIASELSLEVNVPGLRMLPDSHLLQAGKGEEKQGSEHNNKWAIKHADQLRAVLKWDVSVGLGDLPLDRLDELVSHFFLRVVKVDGSPYPSSSLMNLMNCYNRIIRRASEVRAVKGVAGYFVEKNFNINSHPAFTKTRMVIKATIKMSAKAGVNKKRVKSDILTDEHEKAILADIDHQVTSSRGCQKRLAFYCLVRSGIRGGSELWDLRRQDIQVAIDKKGKEYIKFEERTSKNNSYTLDHYNKEKFHAVYHSYEGDFILTMKQYLRHLPPEDETSDKTSKPDLFLGPITNPNSNVWYNKVHKVPITRTTKWLKCMAELVGLQSDLFTNKSGRATLVTRMAARGVPDAVGMLVTSHHSQSGYSRYDRSHKVKMVATTLVSGNPGLTYEDAIKEVSKDFIEDEVIGITHGLKPLMIEDTTVAKSNGKELQPVQTLVGKLLGHVEPSAMTKLATVPNTKMEAWDSAMGEKLKASHQLYDGIDWELEISNNEFLAKYLHGDSKSMTVNVGSSCGNSYANCTINYIQYGSKDKYGMGSRCLISFGVTEFIVYKAESV